MISAAILDEFHDFFERLRASGVSSFEYHAADGGEAIKVSFLPAAPAAQPSTPELTGNAGAPALEPSKEPDIFDVIETRRVPGAPGPDGLPVPASGGQ